MRPTFQRISASEALLVGLPLLAVLVAALWYAARHLQPAPPSTIVISAGSPGGGYFAFAKQYERILARSGVKLEVRSSAGSIENVARLKDPRSGVHLALLQGGIASAKELPNVVSIGRLFYEPLWIFQRAGPPVERLTQLVGKRLAVGPEGSGTRHLMMGLLEANGITPENSTLLPVSGRAAVDALDRDNIDVIFMANAPEAPIVQDSLRNPKLQLMNLAQAEAYSRMFPYLGRVALPQGVVDLVRNIPPAEVQLVAPSAVLVAREDLHPALVYLLAQAAAEVHGTPGLFQQAGDFPKQHDPEFPVSDQAIRFYKNGAPFLQRYLPFWVANLVERAIILLVPLATVAIPLFKFIPWLYRWRVRQKLLRWYAELKRFEASLDARPTRSQVEQLRGEVDRMEDEINGSPVPLGFSEQFYNLRGHIDLVRQRLGTRVAVAE